MKVGFYVQATEHVSVEILSAVLKQAGHTTEAFFDPRIWRDGYCYNKTLSKLFNLEDMLVDEILRSDVDIMCFSVVTDNYATALRVAAKLKAETNIPTIFGGVHCTSVPERVAVKPQVDYTVVGEGEYPLLELVESLSRDERPTKIPNVICKDASGELIVNAPRPTISDLDSLPFLDKDVFYDKLPSFHQKRYITSASRGCVYACTFCNNSMYKRMYNKAGNGKWHRRRSVDNFLEELTTAHKKYNYEYAFFWDEIFIDNREWLEEFCDKYGRALGIPFWCYGYARFINQEIVDMMEQAGCREMNIGVQTIRPETRKIIKRGDRNSKIVDAIRMLGNSKIFLSTGNILQLPGQPVEEALELAEFYNENRVNLPIVGFLRYYPRTDIVEAGLEYGAITEEDVEELEEAATENPFTVSTSKDSIEYRKIETLIQMTTWAPKFLVSFLLRTGAYRYLPTGIAITVFQSRLGNLRSLITGKRHAEENYSAMRYVWVMWKYGLDKLKWKLQRRIGGPKPKKRSETSRITELS